MKRLNLRRALHQCVDLVLDAWESDDAEIVRPVKRPRAFARPSIELPSDVTHEELEVTAKRLKKAGYDVSASSEA